MSTEPTNNTVRQWLSAHWPELVQDAGYVVIAAAGGLFHLALGLALLGVALVLIGNRL